MQAVADALASGKLYFGLLCNLTPFEILPVFNPAFAFCCNLLFAAVDRNSASRYNEEA
jgi:hypothetical protein